MKKKWKWYKKMRETRKVAVLAGGASSEREISLKSGQTVFNALKKKGLNAYLIDIKTESFGELEKITADVVFIALHGKFGEDGSVQNILEEMGLPYTGSGVQASRLALDKVASRGIFMEAGLKVPPSRVITRDQDPSEILKDFEAPFVVKPQHEGSSIGLSIVTDLAHTDTALQMAFDYGEVAIIEEYIHGRELTVGVLEETALPVVEIVTRHSVYDFNAKYLDEGTKYIVPAAIDKALYDNARDLGLRTHKALGCRDFSRVDMRVDRNNNIYILEVNTIPGMTERSLLPKAALAKGLAFEDLCLKLINMAYERRGRG